ncbi:MAG: integration host factor subunit beta [Planctomycetota bacterium]|nr:integration host factor subunit beta [Planctomycetota bacterium]
MTKLDMSLKIAQQVGVDDVVAKQTVQMTLDAMIEALATEGRLELRGFGVFEVRVKEARKARNPRTGAGDFSGFAQHQHDLVLLVQRVGDP